MPLRARLTAAFLAVVLGPVLVCAVAVGLTVSTVADTRAADRLALASATVRAALVGQCRTARAAAEAIAAGWRADSVSAVAVDRPTAPTGTEGQAAGSATITAVTRVVDAGLVDSARLESAAGQVLSEAGRALPGAPASWADCVSGHVPTDTAADSAQDGNRTAISAVVELRDQTGTLLAVARASRLVDRTLAADLAAASGVDVTVRTGTGDPSEQVSTLPAEQATQTVRSTSGAHPDEVIRSGELLVVELPAGPDRPLAVVLGTPRPGFGLLYTGLAAAVLLAGGVTIVLAARLASATTRPLAEVVKAAEAVADGELTARVPVRGRDEVARLAKTFNRMTREMQDYVEALTTSRDQLRGNLALIGDTLSSTHDLDRILAVILETVMAATGARAGMVMLTVYGPDRSPATLVGRCGKGLAGHGADGAPSDPAELQLAVGEGLLGAVAASGEARRGQFGRDGTDGHGIRPAPGEPACQTYIAVPFSRPAAKGSFGAEVGGAADRAALPLGVLALYDRLGVDDFDDGDLVTLRTFAGQAAVAVENVLLHEETRRLSLTDALTGLWNYRSMQDSLQREVERAGRFHRSISVLLIDLDRFKTINDTYGHPAGDAVLAEVAKRLAGEVRDVDFTFRQGGEEFVVLLPDADDDGARRVCVRLLCCLRDKPVRLPATGPGGREISVQVTASIGYAVFPKHAGTVAELLERADLALYAAKSAGRDAFRAADYED